MPLCRRVNADCRNRKDCTALLAGRTCWSVADVACCPRNDKSRCCYCSVYLAYLRFREDGQARPVRIRLAEDPRFSEMGKRSAAHASFIRVLSTRGGGIRR